MSTVVSGTTPYCTPAQAVQCYDVRSLGDFLSDTGTRLVPGDVLASPTLVKVLKEASGMVETAALAGNRYTAADLAALAGTNAGELLSRIVADLAIGLIIRRRPHLDKAVPPQYGEALEWLKQLRSGEKIFGFQEAMDAGNAQDRVEVAADVERRNLSTMQANRLFGDRSDRWQ